MLSQRGPLGSKPHFPANSPVSWPPDQSYVLVGFTPRGYLKVKSDGRFSARIYVKSGPLMTYGVCRGETLGDASNASQIAYDWGAMI